MDVENKTIYEHVIAKAKKARDAARKMAGLSTAVKDKTIRDMADAIINRKDEIIEANIKDVEAARGKLSDAMIDRLTLNDKRIDAMADALREIAAQPDPVGKIDNMVKRPSGIMVGKMTVPIGLIGFIYESRPNVTTDAAAIALKAGNAILLRGGKEAVNSNVKLTGILNEVAVKNGIPDGAVSVIEMTDHEGVRHMAEAVGLIDLIIPRGGKNLIKAVVENAKVPVIKHFDGNCHVYVDKAADLAMALEIAVNAKVQRPGVCNAAETLLVHQDVAKKFLPAVSKALMDKGVELRGCGISRAIVPEMKEATEEDWYTEYNDLIFAVKVMDSLEGAVDHINKYSSSHTDSIVTDDVHAAEYFVTNVDSSSVMVNASTRLSDGGVYGLGAEIGISTDKLHARGPMGVSDLTTYKWVVYGNGALRN